MTASPQIAYFGYGSLVNLATLRTPYISAHRARLKGWRRTWKKRPEDDQDFYAGNDLAVFSIEPCQNTTIEGMVIIDHHTSLPDIDRREAMYERTPLAHDAVEFLDTNPLASKDDLFVYVAHHPVAGQQSKILRSYLDAVMQGYRGQFGDEGLRRFVETTAHFDCTVIEDRTEPFYPRSVVVEETEIALFNSFVSPQA